MKRWYDEDWNFIISVVKVGEKDLAEECRLGFEPGDEFCCQYETPAGFCPNAFIQIHPLLEIIRCGGDLRNLGSDQPCETKVACPDGAVWFKIVGKQIERG
jgi:uncharacterized repeat protein (TIGR04076 family)